MAVYVVGHAVVTDKEAFAKYAEAGLQATKEAGGEFIAMNDGTQTVMEGEQFKNGGMVIIKFPSLQAYKAFYNGPAYQAARRLRRNACKMDVVVLDGV